MRDISLATSLCSDGTGTDTERDRLMQRYERERRRAYRMAGFRAARNMWVGTRRGPIWSHLRYHLLHSLLQRSEALHLAEHFAMLTIPCRRVAS